MEHHNILYAFTHIDLMGQFILVICVIGSTLSWAVVLTKYRLFKKNRQMNRVFRQHYDEKGQDVNQFLKNAMWKHWQDAALPRIYQKIAREAQLLLTEPGVDAVSVRSSTALGSKLTVLDIETLEKMAEREISSEVVYMQTGLNFLAMTSSTGPLLGLLGTVWGIMKTFVDMSQKGSASIMTVAPGVSEALVTTIVGLVVAIPAQIFLNSFSFRIHNFGIEMQNFVSEFISDIERRYVR